MSIEQASISTREQALVELATHLLIGDEQSLKQVREAALSKGLDEREIDAVSDKVREVERSKTENDTTLSELLKKTTQSSCCS